MILESLRNAAVFLARAWTRPWFWAVLAVMTAAAVASPALGDPRSWAFPAILVATLFCLPLIEGPLYTLALAEAPAERSPAGVLARYVRLVVVGVLTDIFLAVPGLLIFVVGLWTAYGMAYAHPGFDRLNVSTWTAGGPVLVGGAVVLGFGGLGIVWLLARVALGSAATVVERRVVMLSSWPLTRGKGWRLVAAGLAVSVIATLMAVVASAGARALAPDMVGRMIPLAIAITYFGFGLPLKVGVLSYFYRHRSPAPTS